MHRDLGFPPGTCATCDDWYGGGQDWPCPTLRLLALPYADHPGYEPEWGEIRNYREEADL
jgi:hypothetical protein